MLRYFTPNQSLRLVLSDGHSFQPATAQRAARRSAISTSEVGLTARLAAVIKTLAQRQKARAHTHTQTEGHTWAEQDM